MDGTVTTQRETFSPYAKVLWPFVAFLDAAMVYDMAVHGRFWQPVATMLVVTLGNLAMGYGISWIRNLAFRHFCPGLR